MNRIEAIKFLRSKGYSKRLSTKLTDIALLQKGYKPAFGIAFEEALQKCEKKKEKTKKPKFIIKE